MATQVGVTEKTNSRAVAMADFDNDGDLDVVVTHQFAVAEVLRNNSSETNGLPWIGFQLAGDGKTVNRDAAGARVLITSNDKSQTREVMMTSGFSAQGDRRLHFGLGSQSGSIKVKIIWPNGSIQFLPEPKSGTYHKIFYEPNDVSHVTER